MIADPPHRARERVIFLDHLKRFLVASGLDQSNIALGTCLGRTGVLARARASFRDQESIGNRLRIRAIDRFPLIQSFVKLVRKEDGTNLCTVIAARAFFQIDITRTFPNLGLEIPGLPFEREAIRRLG